MGIRARRLGAAVAVAVASLGALLAASPGAGAGTGSGTACAARVQRGVLPAWARTGFSDARPRLPHVVGASGRIAALIFGDPLLSPPGGEHNNKILWVAREPVRPLSDLRISARRMVGSRPVGAAVARRVAGGPGPSIIDLPAAGCWRLTLHWSGRADTLDLRYATGG